MRFLMGEVPLWSRKRLLCGAIAVHFLRCLEYIPVPRHVGGEVCVGERVRGWVLIFETDRSSLGTIYSTERLWYIYNEVPLNTVSHRGASLIRYASTPIPQSNTYDESYLRILQYTR